MSEDAARAYAAEIASRLAALLGEELVGVYQGGSLALGGYEPGRSDVDITALVRRPLALSQKQAIVAAARHESLPCPARKLELVVSVPERLPDFELNLNTGEGEHHVDWSPDRTSAFWFAVDASIVRGHAVPLLGPPAADVIPELARELVDTALREAIRWQMDNRVPPDDLVLNASRARRFLEEGVWSSKLAAGEWTLARLPTAEVVESALALRRLEPGAHVSHAEARDFAAAVLRTGGAMSIRTSSRTGTTTCPNESRSGS